MKIVRLTAENVKKIKVVDITPPGGLVQVTGKNGSGKTSVLDSIWWALAGATNVQGVPIRAGEENARIRLSLGDIIVTRTFTADGTKVVVLNAAGAEPGTPDRKLPKWGSPQDILDALLGESSFDPLAFSRMAPKAQMEELRRIAKVDMDFDALDAQNKADYVRRTELNRQAKAKRAQAEGIAVPDGLPDESIDETDFLDRIESAGKHNAAIESERARREQWLRDAQGKRTEAERLRQSAMELRKQADAVIAELRERIVAIEQETLGKLKRFESDADASELSAAGIESQISIAEALPTPIQVSDIRASLDAARVINAGISTRCRRRAINADADGLEAQAQDATNRIAARNQQKADAVAAAQMPVAGLGFGEGTVTYNGLPFEQASDAEQLRVSCSIAMAANAKLRVIRIKDGSLLDEDGLKLIADLAAEKDYQVWLERVDSSGKVGIVMEDGEVAGESK